jgi:uncharacterized protein (DUF1800 family)
MTVMPRAFPRSPGYRRTLHRAARKPVVGRLTTVSSPESRSDIWGDTPPRELSIVVQGSCRTASIPPNNSPHTDVIPWRLLTARRQDLQIAVTAPLSPTAPALPAPSDAARARARAAVAPTDADARRVTHRSRGATTVSATGESAAMTVAPTFAAKSASAKRRKAKKKLPVCTKKDLKKSKNTRRACSVPSKRPSPTGPAAAAPVTTPGTGAWTPAPEPTDGLRTYRGTFGKEQATRLLFRGGFGPLPGQAEEFANLGLEAAVDRLLNPPGGARLEGPAPSGDFLVGGAFAPGERWGHGHLEWLDRLARSTDQLGERMTLVLHDWLAISADGVGQGSDMHSYIELLRSHWRGSMRTLMLDLTVHPAMLQWLNGLWSEKSSPNENYAREIQELFCLGADRGAYSEQDIREFARAFTGWSADWVENVGLTNYRFDPRRWDDDEKVLYAGKPYERRGRFDWRDAVNIVVDHPLHPSYVALRLWSAFIPSAPSPVTLAELERLYRASGEQLAPLVKAILLHPDLYNGPSMTKSPATYFAGMLRARRSGITTEAWIWLGDGAGQQLWYPPNVSGWNERAWLNTTTFEARWNAASSVVYHDGAVADGDYDGSTETPEQAVDAALSYWGNPAITTAHRAALLQLAQQSMQTFYWNDEPLKRTMRQHTLRQLIAAAPDHQVS